MKIADALKLAVGARVKCPGDRGDAPYVGTVEHPGTSINTSITGAEYVWISVRRTGGPASVWPSNRLS